MSDLQFDQSELMQVAYQEAASLLINQKKSPEEVQDFLTAKGMDAGDAANVVSEIQAVYADARKKAAQKDMLWGAIWCVGGIVLTVADIGFIFWGAIVFGAIQFFRGVSKLAD